MKEAREVFAFFRRTEARKAAWGVQQNDPQFSYLFCGIDYFPATGWKVHTNFSREPGRFAHHAGEWISRFLHRGGAWGGDFPTVLAHLPHANRSDVVWSTVDTVGIPLAWLRSLGFLRRPLLYTSIGLPERLDALPAGRWKNRWLCALNACDRMICYGWEESQRLKAMLPELASRIHFVPYGVDVEAWKPLPVPKTCDVLSLGIDQQRDFAQLLPFARRHPDRSVRILTTPEKAAELGELPTNVKCEGPIPLAAIPQAMASARVIALPVRENSYSGATTTLLQAMAMGLPVVVSEVGAIRDGYGLCEANACRLCTPGDAASLAVHLWDLLENPAEAAAMGERARSHVRQHLNWDLYVSRIRQHLLDL